MNFIKKRKKNILIVFLLLLISCENHQLSKITVISYDVKANYDTISRNLLIKASIKVNQIGVNRSINLLFSKLSKIDNIQFIDNTTKFTTTYKFIFDTININVPSNLYKREHLFLNIEYELPLDSLNGNNILMVYRENSWLPYKYSDITEFKIDIQTPTKYVAFSSGDIINTYNEGGYEHFIWKSFGIPDYLLLITPKNFYTLSKKEVENKILNFYLINNDASITCKIMNEFLLSFKYYNSKIAEYKGNHINFYEIPDNEDYAIPLNEAVIASSEKINNCLFLNITNQDTSSLEVTLFNKTKLFKNDIFWISHDIAHFWGAIYQWDSKNFKFLTEGLTEYLRWMYIEDIFGADSMNAVFWGSIKEFKILYYNTIYDIPVSFCGRSDMIQYLKGPIIFHYIRKQIGKDNFIKFVRTLYNKYYGKIIDYEIFKSELSKYDPSGKVIKRMEEFTEMRGILPIQF